MKNVYVDGFVFGREITGLERHFYKTIEVLLDLKGNIIDEITVVTPDLKVTDDRFKIIRIKPILLNFLFYLLAHRKLRDCDVYLGVSGIMPVFISKIVKKRVLFVHDLFWYGARYKSIKNFIYFKLFDLSIKNATSVVAISHETKKHLLRLYGELENVEVIPNYLEFNLLKTKKSDYKKKFLSVGLNSDRKSPLLCFQIAKYFYQKFGYTWVITGLSRPVAKKFKKAGININQEPFIEILLNVSDKELYRLYDECNFTFILSKAEGFCYPVLEAQAHKCIPILSNLDVLEEVAGDKVFLQSSFELDFDKSINKLENLLLDNAKQEKIVKLGLLNIKKFSKNSVKKRVYELFKNL